MQLRLGKPRQDGAARDRFGRDFHVALWETFKGLGPMPRRVVTAAPVVLLVYAVSGANATVLYVATVVAFGVLLFMARPTLDEGAASSGAVQSPAEVPAPVAVLHETAASDGDVGLLTYDAVLSELLALVGRDVQVLVGTGSVAWAPTGMICGRLQTGQNVAQDDDDELLFFAVGQHGSGFFLDRAEFMHGTVMQHGADDGLEVRSAGRAVFSLVESARL